MSHFSALDGAIVGIYIVVTMVAGIAVRKYVGKVDGDTMEGRVNLDEYGEARWTATRHKYA